MCSFFKMYFGRSLILYLVIVTLLYGTTEVYPVEELKQYEYTGGYGSTVRRQYDVIRGGVTNPYGPVRGPVATKSNVSPYGSGPQFMTGRAEA